MTIILWILVWYFHGLFELYYTHPYYNDHNNNNTNINYKTIVLINLTYIFEY